MRAWKRETTSKELWKRQEYWSKKRANEQNGEKRVNKLGEKGRIGGKGLWVGEKKKSGEDWGKLWVGEKKKRGEGEERCKGVVSKRDEEKRRRGRKGLKELWVGENRNRGEGGWKVQRGHKPSD